MFPFGKPGKNRWYFQCVKVKLIWVFQYKWVFEYLFVVYYIVDF